MTTEVRQPTSNATMWIMGIVIGIAILFVGFVASLADPTSGGSDGLGIIMLILLGVGLIWVYFLPTYFGFKRGHPNRWLIFIVNLMTGWTLLAWIFALIWALGKVHQSTVGSQGGESGVNLFVNDEQKVRVIDADNDITSRLERLKSLLDDGAIDNDEYVLLKKRLIE